jgi:hypothetical protein
MQSQRGGELHDGIYSVHAMTEFAFSISDYRENRYRSCTGHCKRLTGLLVQRIARTGALPLSSQSILHHLGTTFAGSWDEATRYQFFLVIDN